MTTIYWIRHAEAEGNLYRRCHGQYDSMITVNGLNQLVALRERFSDVALDAVYSSDLYRAWATANALAQPRGLIVTTHPGLREISLGVWEDLTWVEVGRKWSDSYDAFSNRQQDFEIEGGESTKQVCTRVVETLRQIAARHDGQTVAIVSHGWVTRVTMALIQGMKAEHCNALQHGDNTSVSKLVCEGRRIETEYYADNSHLGEGLSTLAKQQWWRENDGLDRGFWFRPLDFEKDGALFTAYRRDAWQTVYGSLERYDSEVFLNEARHISAHSPEAIQIAMDGDRPAGMLQLEFNSPLQHDAGHIMFFYLTPEYRGKGMGIQLLGQAVSECRRKARRSITLRVFDGNRHAISFYQKHGMMRFGEEPSFSGKLHLMALDIEVPAKTPVAVWRQT